MPIKPIWPTHAAGRRRTIKSRASGLWLVLLLVLIGHGISLSWLAQQWPRLKPLPLMAEPLFTRLIMPHLTAPQKLSAKPKPARPRRRAPVKPAPDLIDPVPAAAMPDVQAQDQAQTEPASPMPADDASAPAAAAESEASAAVIEESASALDSWPSDTRVSYQLTGNYRGPLYGSARVQWQREQSRYQVRVDLRMALVLGVSMISQGEVSDTGLRPQVYEERFLGSVRRVAFDDGRVKFHDGSQVLAPPALQDTVSQLVELSHRFSSGREALKVGAQVNVWLARPQGMAWWTYDVTEEEMLMTPELGPVSAFHLVPRPITNPSGVITAELWFAPSLQYLPVRLRISLGSGNFVDLLVDHIEQTAQTR
jgi:hypothetical protein